MEDHDHLRMQQTGQLKKKNFIRCPWPLVLPTGADRQSSLSHARWMSDQSSLNDDDCSHHLTMMTAR